jgi:hypothetical protein
MRVVTNMSKGSRSRPFSVSQTTFGNNYDTIFGKKNKMTPSVESMKKGTCGCGRSPTGNCCGWHSLTEEVFQARLAEFTAKQAASNVKDSNQGG